MRRMFFVFMEILVMALIGTGLCTGTSEHHNYNGDNHDDLCSVLKAAVTLYHSPRGGEKLKKALERAIFGNESGEGDIETLKKDLPHEFKHPGYRRSWCGTCLHSDGKHYPGWSIPHDLICMCTVGSGGHPFTHYSHDNGKTPKLCGKQATELGCDENQEHGTGCHSNNTDWWTDSTLSNDGNGQVKEHLNATWNTVVKPCLTKGPDGRARETLLEKLKVGHQQTPSWGAGHSRCTGSHSDVCVNYASTCHDNPKSTQWWQELYDALETTEETRTKGNSTRSPRKRTRRKTGGATTPDETEDESEEDEPDHAGSTSTNNRQLPLLSHQQSGAPLTQPLLFLLSASLFI